MNQKLHNIIQQLRDEQEKRVPKEQLALYDQMAKEAYGAINEGFDVFVVSVVPTLLEGDIEMFDLLKMSFMCGAAAMLKIVEDKKTLPIPDAFKESGDASETKPVGGDTPAG